VIQELSEALRASVFFRKKAARKFRAAEVLGGTHARSVEDSDTKLRVAGQRQAAAYHYM